MYLHLKYTCLIRLLDLIKHLYLSGIRLGVSRRMDTKKTRVKSDQIMCSKYGNYSKFNDNQHNWEDLYDCLMSTRIFTLIMN